jgi:hypothetical protein
MRLRALADVVNASAPVDVARFRLLAHVQRHGLTDAVACGAERFSWGGWRLHVVRGDGMATAIDVACAPSVAGQIRLMHNPANLEDLIDALEALESEQPEVPNV